MSLPDNPSKELVELLTCLDEDRAWLLEQLDNGRWPNLRLELAALERELSRLLIKVSECYEKESDLEK